MYSCFFFLMIRRPPRSTRTDTLVPYTTLFRSSASGNWSQGSAAITADLRFTRVNPPDGPYPLSLGLAPADSDGVQLLPAAIDLDIDGDSVDRKSTRLNSSH